MKLNKCLEQFNLKNYIIDDLRSDQVREELISSLLVKYGSLSALVSSIAGYVGENHEFFWAFFGFCGVIGLVFGSCLKYQKYVMDKEIHDLTVVRLRKEIDEERRRELLAEKLNNL